nr:hypothetical protein [Tanacetum cinerariifolium]
DPSSTNLREEEAVYLAAFTHAKLDEQRFLKKKAIIDWLHEGDSNTAYIHRLVKVKGSKVHPLIQERLFVKRLSPNKANKMVRSVLGDEIRRVMFGIANDKSPRSDGCPPKYAFKVDIQKAYDTVSWKLLEDILWAFGFHPRMVQWIMAFVTSTSFSININKDLDGYFCDDDFTYHHKCSKFKIVNICFMDGLLLFARGDVHLTRIIMKALEEFKEVLGLVPSISKSTIIMCNVSDNQERNNRIHGKGAQNADDVVWLIIDTAHLQFPSIPFKRNMRVEKLRRTWKFTSV